MMSSILLYVVLATQFWENFARHPLKSILESGGDGIDIGSQLSGVNSKISFGRLGWVAVAEVEDTVYLGLCIFCL